MGCDTGQDNERPVHRVWVDEFLLAEFQVTNADYSRFVLDTKSQPPPFWSDPAFSDPMQAVAGVSWYEAVRYCEWLSARTGEAYFDCRLKLSGNARLEEGARAGCFPGVMSLRNRFRNMVIAVRVIGEAGRSRVGEPNRTHTVFTTCATTCTSGAATGIRPIIMRYRRSAIRGVLKTATGALLAADLGATTLKFRAARHARAFLPISNMPTMDFALRAMLTRCSCMPQSPERRG